MGDLKLWVHGRGNAWPVPLGESHPFYDRTDPKELSNAAFSLILENDGLVDDDVLVDAGHGTIQSLLSGSNRIPDCLCLTHGHMDHTLSVDWVVQSYWRKHDKGRLYPVFATAPVYDFLLRSYPQLEELIQFNKLIHGIRVPVPASGTFGLTSYPVFHGKSALGASMLLFETEGKRVLFTGDLFSPLLRKKDYKKLKGIDLLVVDSNNRFPWPGTNHWSFSGHPEDPLKRSDPLTAFLETLSWEDVIGPQALTGEGNDNLEYFSELEEEWSIENQPFTILEFIRKIEPGQVMLVHYSGAEDDRYYDQKIFSSALLTDWVKKTALDSGIGSRFIIPQVGQTILI